MEVACAQTYGVTVVVAGDAKRIARRALLVAIPLAAVVWVTSNDATNELLTSTHIAVLVAVLCVGLALMTNQTNRSWGLAIALGAIAAAPLFVACLFLVFVAWPGGPIG